MEPSRNKGTFVCYRESSKAYIIYVSGERHVEVSITVKFNKEDAFMHTKEIHCDSHVEEHDTPMMEDPNFGSPHLDVEREKLEENSYLIIPKEPIELVEISLDEPPSKRRSTWC